MGSLSPRDREMPRILYSYGILSTVCVCGGGGEGLGHWRVSTQIFENKR